jgi:hypothetical protein
MPFAELAALKTMMRIPSADTSRDAELQLYVDYANSMMYDVFGGISDSVVTTYTDTISIDDSQQNSFWLRRYPLVSVTSLTQNGNVLSPSAYSYTDLGCIRMMDSLMYFPFGTATVQVTYTAGFATGNPALGELRIAALTMATYVANIAARAGISSEKIGQYSYDIGAAMGGLGNTAAGGFGMPPMVERILNKWDRSFMVFPNTH